MVEVFVRRGEERKHDAMRAGKSRIRGDATGRCDDLATSASRFAANAQSTKAAIPKLIVMTARRLMVVTTVVENRHNCALDDVLGVAFTARS